MPGGWCFNALPSLFVTHSPVKQPRRSLVVGEPGATVRDMGMGVPTPRQTVQAEVRPRRLPQRDLPGGSVGGPRAFAPPLVPFPQVSEAGDQPQVWLQPPSWTWVVVGLLGPSLSGRAPR